MRRSLNVLNCKQQAPASKHLLMAPANELFRKVAGDTNEDYIN